jgi:hypothetical protein
MATKLLHLSPYSHNPSALQFHLPFFIACLLGYTDGAQGESSSKSHYCVFQKCIQYSTDVGFPETGKLAQQLSGTLELNTEQKTRLTSIVGQEVMQTPNNTYVA